MAQWHNSRQVKERIFIRGLLHLDTPTHFGGGDEGSTDMPLLYDAKDNHLPLLPGTSIAGALRNYLREYEKGYQWCEDPKLDEKSWAEELFGYLDDQPDPNDKTRRQKSSVLSWLMVDDALGQLPALSDSFEMRDGVSIDPKTRTAEKGKKFDTELLPAGTTFPLSFELWVNDSKPNLLTALAIALHGLEHGGVGLGKRKRRGYGCCHVSGWQVWRYKMNNIEQIIGWLNHPYDQLLNYQPDIYRLLEITPSLQHQGTNFQIKAQFALNGSLLIRSYGSDKNAPDAVHLRSWREGKNKPVLPGTSLAGVLRARASKIANTLGSADKANAFITTMFGGETKDEKENETLIASRLVVSETIIEPEKAITDLVQNRISIDRFTGGARDTALFDEQPVWGRPETEVTVDLRLINPQPHEIGLLLLLLKDLWTGDLALGGESSVGRGRLKGKSATMVYKNSPIQTWQITADGDKLRFGNETKPEELEKFVQALYNHLNGGQA